MDHDIFKTAGNFQYEMSKRQVEKNILRREGRVQHEMSKRAGDRTHFQNDVSKQSDTLFSPKCQKDRRRKKGNNKLRRIKTAGTILVRNVKKVGEGLDKAGIMLVRHVKKK